MGGPVCACETLSLTLSLFVSTNTFAERAGLCFRLSTDVIVFLMVLEVITPRNVTRRLVLSSEPQHGGCEAPYVHTILRHK